MLGIPVALVQKTTAAAIVSAASPPKTVTEGILDLLAVPAGQAQSPHDRKRLLRLYAESVDGFPLGTVERVLKKLRFNNPRNPFPATPQDVRERCVSALKTWTRRIEAFYFGQRLLPEVSHFAPDGRARSIEERNLLVRKQRHELQGKWEAGEGDIIMSMIDGCEIENFGPEPFKPGCVLPENMVLAILRSGIPSRWSTIIEMSLENFDRIPVEAFPDDTHQRAIDERNHTAYVESLDPRVRAARARIIARYRYCLDQIPTEAAIMEKVQREIGEENSERRRAIEEEDSECKRRVNK